MRRSKGRTQGRVQTVLDVAVSSASDGVSELGSELTPANVAYLNIYMGLCLIRDNRRIMKTSSPLLLTVFRNKRCTQEQQ